MKAGRPLPKPEVCYRRYEAAMAALKEIRARADGAAFEFKHMKGLPNEIAREGGVADGLAEAADVLDAAMRKVKR